jgi:A/G-specific adenine glycosylase
MPNKKIDIHNAQSVFRITGYNRVGNQKSQTFPTAALFGWYDKHGRDLPWRRRWPDLAPAYHVWLSEIMLQQTVVATVIPYFLDFTRRWPTINDLASAPLDDVLAAWAGLGYYARARNLHKAAVMVATEWGGQFSGDHRHANAVADLRALPGVGPYTAGAIAAIAFGQQAVVVDGNIERLFSRYFAITTPLPAAKTEIAAAYAAILPVDRPSDWPQALMDFANAVCTPKQPLCDGCCFAESCQALARGLVDQLPVKPVKTPKPVRRAIAFVAVNDQGEIFLHRRPDKGLLGGMLAFPEIGLASKQADQNLDQTMAPFAADWVLLDEPVLHVFTHFALEMKICLASIEGTPQPIIDDIKGHWAKPRPADLPSLMRKIWKAAAAMPMKPGSSR